MEIVRLAGVAGSTLSAKQTVQRHLSDGSALEKFKDLIRAQGGDTSYVDHPEKFPQAKHIRKLPAPKRGYVHTINAAMIARGVHLLGAGRDLMHEKIDYAIGVSEIKKVGTQVKQGEPLMMIHYDDEAKLEQSLEYFKNAYRLARNGDAPAADCRAGGLAKRDVGVASPRKIRLDWILHRFLAGMQLLWPYLFNEPRLHL